MVRSPDILIFAFQKLGLEQVSGHHPKTRVMDLFEHMLEMQASACSVSSTDRCFWAYCGAEIHGSQVSPRLFPDGDAEHAPFDTVIDRVWLRAF